MPEPEKPEEPTPGETPEQKALREALAEAEKWKALSRKNEEQAKSNAGKAKKFDEHEEANKSEIEKITARAEAAEKAIAEREATESAAKLREEIATEKGFADRKIKASALRGSTREELEAHADELLDMVPAPPAAPSADGQGQVGTPIKDGEMSADDIVAAAVAR
jgi:membrane protein involved in colicin uptake